jgi:NADPH:quinone reductase-like Zn-dependent oxidoreductase
VRFDRYGGLDVLQVVDVERPVPGPGQLLIAVEAAGINPGEGKIREGLLHDRFPATFPSGEGSDLAGVVEEAGEGVEHFGPGDEVIGWSDNRDSHSEFVVIEADHATPRPQGVPWEVAGSLFVAGCTAYATVRAVAAGAGEVLVVSGAAGGVGGIAVQLARLNGATVIGLASDPNHEWLRAHGVIPVSYGDGVEERIRIAANGTVDTFIDTVGGGYVQLALSLGVAPGRIDTIADFAAASLGVKLDGNAAGASAAVLAELAGLIADGKLEVPIARAYPLERVADAFAELQQGHTRGKIVLVPDGASTSR